MDRLARALYEGSSHPMWICRSDDLTLLDANSAFASFTGRAREELVSCGAVGLNFVKEEASCSRGSGTAHPCTSRLIEAEVRPLSGPPMVIRGAGLDCEWEGEEALLVTASISALSSATESSLRESEARFRKAIEESPFPQAIHAEDGEVLSVSKAWLEGSGYSVEDLQSVTAWIELAHCGNAERAFAATRLEYDYCDPQDEGNWEITTKSGDKRTWHFTSMGLGRLPDGRRLALTTAYDLTDRLAMLRALDESDRRFKRAIDSCPFPMMMFADDGEILAISRAVCVQSGYDRSELVNVESWVVRGHIGEEEAARKLIESCFDLAAPKEMGALRVRSKQNEDLLWEFSAVGLGRLRDGRRVALGSAFDVTPHKRFAEALKESEARLKRAIEEAPFPVAIHALGPEVIAMSRSWIQGTGYEAEDMQDIQQWTFAAFGKEASRLLRGTGEVLEGKVEKFAGEFTLKTKSGETKTWEIVTVAAGSTSDGRNMAISIAYDSTERNRVEESLLLQNTAITAAANGVVITDKEGFIIYVNPAFTSLTGYTIEEAIGRRPGDLVGSGAHPASFFQDMWQTISSGGVWQGELTNRRKDGSFYHEEMTITPVRGQCGEISHFVAIKQDITERREAQERVLKWNEELEVSIALRTAELALAKREAERANKAKSEFLSRMSHELRTPLNSILGFAQVLQLKHLGKEADDASEPILKAGQHLLALIDDILDISRIEVGKLSVSKEPSFTAQVVSDALDLVYPMAAKAEVSISHEVSPEASCFVGDARRAVQILVNLLTNGIKYNHKGGNVTVKARRHEELVIFEVSDTGPGISAVDEPKLFEPFVRFGDKFVEGTGLGLSLSRKLAQAMGGDVFLSSTSSSGSTFVFCLPFCHCPASASHSEQKLLSLENDSSALYGNVLYIEDDLENVQLVEEYFGLKPNLRLYPVILGLQGLDFARLHKPDVIILDSHLPDIDGIQILELLKVDESTHSIPVIILTADASSDHRAMMLAAGADAFLTKPIGMETLMETVNMMLSRGSDAER